MALRQITRGMRWKITPRICRWSGEPLHPFSDFPTFVFLFLCLVFVLSVCLFSSALFHSVPFFFLAPPGPLRPGAVCT